MSSPAMEKASPAPAEHNRVSAPVASEAAQANLRQKAETELLELLQRNQEALNPKLNTKQNDPKRARLNQDLHQLLRLDQETTITTMFIKMGEQNGFLIVSATQPDGSKTQLVSINCGLEGDRISQLTNVRFSPDVQHGLGFGLSHKEIARLVFPDNYKRLKGKEPASDPGLKHLLPVYSKLYEDYRSTSYSHNAVSRSELAALISRDLVSLGQQPTAENIHASYQRLTEAQQSIGQAKPFENRKILVSAHEELLYEGPKRGSSIESVLRDKRVSGDVQRFGKKKLLEALRLHAGKDDRVILVRPEYQAR